MATKYELITELYKRTQKNVAEPQEWQRFLTTACRNFRLSFDEQLLLYAQRPDATAVLEIDKWNRQFGRWVNRGATGIAVFDGDTTGRARLKYYFDVSDTHPGRFSRRVPIWTMRREYEQEVTEALENSFGELENKYSLGSALISVAKNAVEDNMQDYLQELHYYKENSFLEELDDLNIEVQYRNALQNSVAYMLLMRCGIDPSDYFTDDDFRGVVDFNTPQTLNALGVATGDIAQMCLTEISRTVTAIERQPEKQNRTFADVPKDEYPVIGRNNETERSDEHERADIHDAGRVPSAQPAAPAGAGGDAWEIRPYATPVSPAAPQSDLHQPSDQREADGASAGDRADGESPDGADHSADGESRGRDGGTERHRSDEMGRADEQHSADGGGNGADGADLQLTSDDLAATQIAGEQRENAGGDVLPAFLNERLINAILSNPEDDLIYKKQQIEMYFAAHPDVTERAEYLKSAYQDRYTELLVGSDRTRVGYKPQEDGLLMWEGAYLSRTSESVFSWQLVAELTAQVIERGEYHINRDIKGLKSQNSQQMSLFDMAMPTAEPVTAPAEPVSYGIRYSQQVIDEALCIGANDRNSRLIVCAYFMKDKPLEENARFLMRHYGTNGAGFYLNDRQYAIWYSGEGIRLSSGDSAQSGTAMLISWEDAAKRIRELLDLGRYMPQAELDRVQNYEYQQVAESLWYLWQDFDDGAREQALLPTVNGIYMSHGGFPENTAQIAELLKQPDSLQTFVDELGTFLSAYEADRDILRFHFHRPREILQRLADLQREPVIFTAAESYESQRRQFITMDEVDKLLRSGSTHYRLGVYSYYLEHPDIKERAKYLQSYHGDSGSYGGNDNTSYGSKGLSFSHGDITAPYAKLDWSWTKVARRIETLIHNGSFLSDEDRAAIPEYERRELATVIQGAFYDLPDSQPRPFSHNPIADYWKNVEEIQAQLTDPAKVEEIYQMLVSVADGTKPEDRYYTSRQEALAAMISYRDGTYSLFGEKREPRPIAPAPLETEPEAEQAAEEQPSPFIQHFYVIPDLKVAGQLEVQTYSSFEESFAAYTALPKDKLKALGVQNTMPLPGSLDFIQCREGVDTLVEDYLTAEGWDNPEISQLVDAIRNQINQLASEQEQPAAAPSDRVDEMLRQAMLAAELSEQTGQNVFAFEEGSLQPVNAPTPAPTVPKPATLAPPKQRREHVEFSVLHPEIPAGERHDFHITDPELGYGTPTEKYNANVEAIRTLKKIEAEGRLAAPEEQTILSRYVGWGGLADCFDERSSHYEELKSLLDEDEYAAARASTLTAFYTSPVIIDAVYSVLSQMGFQTGNILEPACGVGNFIGRLPDSMAGSKAYGVEIDSISGRIAQQLYQNSRIAVDGFEKVQMPDSFFDMAVGNVPFGDFKVLDKQYDKYHWLIHDYFFGKTLDKVRPGGIVAFITSKGTMDKENSAVRKYLAQRADLIGAIRLPDNAFKRNAGTEVTSDIIFLQKRDRMTDIEPDWVHLDTNENGIRMNSYFVQHPDMVLGNMVMESTRFGMDSACKAEDGTGLSEQLRDAISNLHAEITAYEVEELTDEEEDCSIPADPAVRNFSFCLSNGTVYYRENSRMYPVEVSVTAENRIRGMIAIRDSVRRLIELQTEDYPDEDIKAEQAKLNRLYDEYTRKYGILNSQGNKLAFGEDASYCLLCSLEVLDEEGNFERKADMFTKRTIRPHVPVTSVDTASEALAVSIAEKARVDMAYMSELSGKTEEELEADLAGVIFRDVRCAETAGEIPAAHADLSRFPFVTADEYLSGNVRRKLRMAKAMAEVLPAEKKEQIQPNITALEAVQPVDLTAGEIGVRIGVNWIPTEIYEQFMYEMFGTRYYGQDRIHILRSAATGEWNITNKNADSGNIKTITTYGTKRINAYHILEQTLNQKDVRIFDYVYDENGNKKPVLNKKETAIAQDRQELIKAKFVEWVWKDIDRRERLCRIYNETFNSIRPL